MNRNSISLPALGVALLVGLLLGFGFNFFGGTKEKPFNTSAYLERINLGRAIEGYKKCIVINNNVQVMKTPSNLTNEVVGILHAGNEVEYVETVDSFDKRAEQAVTLQNVEIREWFHRNIYLPKGSLLEISKETEDSYICNIEEKGKTVSKKIAKKYLKRAYIGSWQKIKLNGQEGFLKASDATAPKFM